MGGRRHLRHRGRRRWRWHEGAELVGVAGDLDIFVDGGTGGDEDLAVAEAYDKLPVIEIVGGASWSLGR